MSRPAPRAAVVVLAAGSGSRVGHDVNKALLSLGGRPMLAWSLETAAACAQATQLVLVVSERDRSSDEVGSVRRLGVRVVVGGRNRHESERLALESLAADIESGDIDVVVMHDAARPLATAELLETVILTAHQRGGAIPVRPQPAVVAADPDDAADVALGLRELVAVQTPQAFQARPLLAAYRAAHATDFIGTDTASCVEAFSDLEVVGVAGAADNLKVTFADDVAVAERLAQLRRAGAAPATADRRGR
jgi:2-C-methyl-D-erythritol 4-phosphate cytidylyltransferase